MKKKLAENGLDYDGPPPLSDGDEEARPPPISPKPVIGRLTDDRIRRLEGLGFVWSLRDDWAKHYDELKGEHSFLCLLLIFPNNSTDRRRIRILNRVQK